MGPAYGPQLLVVLWCLIGFLAPARSKENKERARKPGERGTKQTGKRAVSILAPFLNYPGSEFPKRTECSARKKRQKREPERRNSLEHGELSKRAESWGRREREEWSSMPQTTRPRSTPAVVIWSTDSRLIVRWRFWEFYVFWKEHNNAGIRTHFTSWPRSDSVQQLPKLSNRSIVTLTKGNHRQSILTETLIAWRSPAQRLQPGHINIHSCMRIWQENEC